MAKSNDGAPGSDGVTFEAIEERGVEGFLEQIRDELTKRSYLPLRARKKEIPKEGSTKVRTLSIPCIRDRVVQGALKLIVEPIFEADFQPGSYGYRPKRSAQQAVSRVADAIAMGKTQVIDIDLAAYFDGVRHDLLLAKVAKRISDPDVLHLLKSMLKANGKRGVPQGGVITPRTQKVTLAECVVVGSARSWRGATRRGATCRGRRGDRNAVSDDDAVIAYQNLLDDQTHDPLAFQCVKCIGAAAQPGQERGEGLCQAQERGALIGLVSDSLQFGT
ncbi:MAG: reverse transcriptase domain-containing protein [Candidatus Binataceae bacterium]